MFHRSLCSSAYPCCKYQFLCSASLPRVENKRTAMNKDAAMSMNAGMIVKYVSRCLFAVFALLLVGGVTQIAYVVATSDNSQPDIIDVAGARMAKGLTAIGLSLSFAC